jgi:hypothetical protein
MLVTDVKAGSHSRIKLLRKLTGDIVGASRKKAASTSLGTMLAVDVRLRAKGPMQLVEDLVEDIRDLNLQQGISNRPDPKLEAAQRALDGLHANDKEVAVAALRELISTVEAQRPDEGGLAKDDAKDLIDAAREVISLLATDKEPAVPFTPS